jgi:hypothetical protein
MRITILSAIALLTFGAEAFAQNFPDNTPVYYNGGNRGHIEGCRRISPEAKAAGPNTTYGAMIAQGGQLCSRCPGSALNQEREGVQPAPAKGLPGGTIVYYAGGKRGHIETCRRFSPEMKIPANRMTLAEMQAKGGQLCSRCPGSELNQEREGKPVAQKSQYDPNPTNPKEKYGRKGAKAREQWLEYPEQHYDPNTKVVCDALWMRVHEEDCPELLLKDQKKVMTLEQADREGWRIGETGQSGRERCCFKGYRRKYPEKGFTENTPGIVQVMKSEKLKWHQAGCHRFTVSPEDLRMTPKEAAEAATARNTEFYMCEHCIERGLNLTTADLEELQNRPTPPEFTAQTGWTPKPFPADGVPSQKEIDILIEEGLAKNGFGILETPYEEPLASLEDFMGRRFFFPVESWLYNYQAYRATGDKRFIEALNVSARHYRDLCMKYPDVAQLKASDTEGMSFMYSMAVSARITLQLARKYPGQVSPQQLAEAESFLKAIVSTLQPIVEGSSNLDPEMAIPQHLADDFRTRAFNRALNGIGTIAMTTAALEDLQAIKNTSGYQTQIDRYKTCIREYFKNWKKEGCLYTEADGKTYFYYPYMAGGETTRRADGLLLGGADDAGHYSHSMQGVMLVHDATPELGADDAFMTAIANAIYHNSTTENGSIQCPTADRIQPLSRHEHSPGPKNRFYMFEAFRDGLIEGQNADLNANKRMEMNSEYSYRLKTLHAQYLKALRRDRSLVHLGGK